MPAHVSKGLKPGDQYTRVMWRPDPMTGTVTARRESGTYQPKGSRAALVPAVTRLVERGYRYGEIAETLGISHATVKAVVAEFAIPYPHGPGRPKQS